MISILVTFSKNEDSYFRFIGNTLHNTSLLLCPSWSRLLLTEFVLQALGSGKQWCDIHAWFNTNILYHYDCDQMSFSILFYSDGEVRSTIYGPCVPSKPLIYVVLRATICAKSKHRVTKDSDIIIFIFIFYSIFI